MKRRLFKEGICGGRSIGLTLDIASAHQEMEKELNGANVLGTNEHQ